MAEQATLADVLSLERYGIHDVAEIIRSGILSIQRGQVEAAMSSGMSFAWMPPQARMRGSYC